MKKHKTISINERGLAIVELRYKVALPLQVKDFVCARLDNSIPRLAQELCDLFSILGIGIDYKLSQQKTKGGAK